MDDQQMDQWFADKLKKEQEFDYQESDWESIADRMDRQEEKGKRRRLFWLWWPVGTAATFIIGLFLWQQQQQIIDLREQLTELQTLDTVRKTIIIQDTIQRTITLSPEESNSQNSQTDLERQGTFQANTNTETSNTTAISNSQLEDTSEKGVNKNIVSEITPHNISNSSVVNGRPQLSVVDSSAEIPTFFSSDGERETADGKRRTMDHGRETPARLTEAGQTGDGKLNKVSSKLETRVRVEQFLILTKLPMLVPIAVNMDNTIPDISLVEYQEVSTNKTAPIGKWKPVFELDAALGLGQPDINVSNLFDQGQAITYNLGTGLSMQTFKRLWVRVGVSHQTHRYYSNEPDAASAYALDDNSDIELLRDSSQVNPSASIPVNSIKDKNQYWQFELGVRYHWLQKKKWGAYVRGDMLSRFLQDRNTELKVLTSQFNGPDFMLANETINSRNKGFSVIGLQLGTGANYRLNKHWQLSFEGNVVLNTNQVVSSSILLPKWDLRIGSRFNF